MKLRKPMQRKQGLKFLWYGEDGSGKSVAASTFPGLAIVDTEAKWGVYENDPRYNKNIVGLADTTAYFDVIDLASSIVSKPEDVRTFLTDSETNLHDSMKVAMMVVEEKKARKKNYSVDDATVSMRGWGKVGLNYARLKNYRVQMSALGITVISIAHKKDVYDKDENVKIGERPDLKDTSKHDYDVIVRFYKEQDGNKIRFMAEIEKDSTNTYPIGTRIENFTYDNFKEYIERTSSYKSVDSSYDKAIDDNEQDSEKEDEQSVSLKDEVVALALNKIKKNRKVAKSVIKKYVETVDPRDIDENDVEKLNSLKAELETITQ